MGEIDRRPDSGRGDAEAPAGRGLEHLGRRLLVPAALGLVVLVGLALVADVRELGRELRRFDPWLLAPVLALSLVNYGLRFARWEIYLKALGVRLPRGESLGVFLVGFALSVTPGKAGELGKAWLARELGGGAARRTVAAVLAERVTDLLGVLALVAGTAAAATGRAWIAAAALALGVLLVALLTWGRAARGLIGFARRLPGVRGPVGVLGEVYERLRELLRASRLIPAVVLAALAWGAEGLGFWLVVRSYAPAAPVATAIFSYAASTLAGAASMLPGGLVASEGALTALLGLQGLTTAAAASATLVIRAATLWFAVALGLLALPWVFRRLRRPVGE